jgi:hypothetical protein
MRSPQAHEHPVRARRHWAAVAVIALLVGCASMQPPKPWQKANLAKPAMQFDADPIDARLADHVYTSKEAGSGGYGVGGGGCGCN